MLKRKNNVAVDGAIGARAALKGYRYQVLCALVWHFRNPKSNIKLEGKEDFDLVPDGKPPVFYQAKADQSLSLSSLLPTYFKRVYSRPSESQEYLVLAFPPGPELKAAWDNDQVSLAAVSKKLAEKLKIETDHAEQLFKRVKYIVHSENELEQELSKAIQRTGMVGHIETTRDLLLAWVSQASEESLLLKPGDLQARLQSVAEYLSKLDSYTSEWNVSIEQLPAIAAFSKPIEKLEEEFIQGVAARFEHIASGVSIDRTPYIEQVSKAFERSQIVVIRGASGQGKTTLAFQFLRDHALPGLRFSLHPSQDGSNYRRVFLALAAYLDAFDLPIYCFLDVASGFEDWTRFVSILQAHKQINLLVCIRNDDWNSTAFDGSFLAPPVVDLELTRDVASQLFDGVTKQVRESVFPDFEDAWTAFGESGPLLEFIYLLRKGETLESRLKTQVSNLSTEEVEILRYVSLADMCGSPLILRRIATGDRVRRVVQKLEKEHLLRESAGVVAGTHPVRSRIVTRLLHDEYVELKATSCQILRGIPDQHLESFLLCLFYEHPATRSALLGAILEQPPRTWDGVGGVLRALLWLGLRQNLELNSRQVDAAHERFGKSAFIMLYEFLDCGKLTALGHSAEPFWTSKDSVFDNARDDCLKITGDWISKEQIHLFAEQWLKLIEFKQVSSPKLRSEWQGFCWYLHWSSLLGMLAESGAIEGVVPFSWPKNLSLEVGCQVHQALSTVLECDSLKRLQRSLVSRYQEEYLAIKIEYSESETTCDYLVSPNRPKESYLPREHLALLRALYPQSNSYSATGWGYPRERTLVDGDWKKSAVARSAILPHWSVDINMWLDGLLQLEYRPRDWKAFVAEVLDVRNLLLNCIETVNTALEQHWEVQDLYGVMRSTIDPKDLRLAENKSGHLLPAEIADRFGRMHEGVDLQCARVPASLRKYIPFIKCFNNLRFYAEAFFRQIFFGILIEASDKLPKLEGLRQRHQKVLASASELGHSSETPRIAWRNAMDMYLKLHEFQQMFASHFGSFVDPEELRLTDQSERAAFRSLMLGLASTANDPNRMEWGFSDCETERSNYFVDLKKELKSILKPLRKYISSVRLLEVSDDEGYALLCVVCDLSAPKWIDVATETALAAVRTLIPAVPADPRSFVPAFYWPRFALIETVFGHLVEPKCRIIDSVYRYEKHLSSEEKLSFYEEQPMPGELADAFPSAAWKYDPKDAKTLKTSWEKSVYALETLTSVLGMPEFDESVRNHVQAWTNEVSVNTSLALQEMLDSLSRLLSCLADIGESNPELACGLHSQIESLGAFLTEAIKSTGTSRTLLDWSTFLENLRAKADEVNIIKAAWLELVMSWGPIGGQTAN